LLLGTHPAPRSPLHFGLVNNEESRLMGPSDKDARRADFSDVQGGSSSTAPPARPLEQARSYTVAAGDSLSKIAKREYGDANKWPAIFEANRDKIKDPDRIHPGQVLTLPPNA
jgi:nucleoid-associated protein YgaU